MTTNADPKSNAKQNRIQIGLTGAGRYTYGSLTEPVASAGRGLGPGLVDVGDPNRYVPTATASRANVTVTDDDGNMIVTVAPRPGGRFEVVSVNPFGGDPIVASYDMGFIDVAESTNDAEFSVRYAQSLVDNDPEIAEHIESLSYVEKDKSVIVVLKGGSTIAVDVQTGRMGSAPASGIGGRSPADMMVNYSADFHQMSPREAARAVRDIVNGNDGYDESDHYGDSLTARKFAARLLVPVRILKNSETGYRPTVARLVDEQHRPGVLVGNRGYDEVENDERNDVALAGLLQQAVNIVNARESDTRVGAIHGNATMIAALRLSEDNPTPGLLESERQIVTEQLNSGVTGQQLLGPAAGAITDDNMLRAASLMAKAVHRDFHTTKATEHTRASATTILAGLKSLQDDGQFTTQPPPDVAITHLVNGDRLDGVILLNGTYTMGDTPSAGWYSPRLPALHGFWQ